MKKIYSFLLPLLCSSHIVFAQGNEIVREYYANGQLKSEGAYADDKAVGLHKEYYENGNLKHEANYKDDEKFGIEKEYYEDGSLGYEEIIEGGRRIAKRYDKDGTLLEEK